MKIAGSAMLALLQLLVACTLFAVTANGMAYEVASCADIAQVDDTMVTALTVTSSEINCAEYTRFRVRNAMTISATVPEVTFSNFALKVLGELTVEPNVVFTGVYLEEKRGGVLHVSDGATATFMGTANFNNNSNMQRELPFFPCGDVPEFPGTSTSIYQTRYDYSGSNCYLRGYIKLSGGCIYNKGYLVFEDDATFEGNTSDVDGRDDRSKGGAIANTSDGTIIFKGKLTMVNNLAQGIHEGSGGAILNRGDIVVEGESYFTENHTSDGGVIYQRRTGSIQFNSMATFFDNGAVNLYGGAIFNKGGLVSFNAGSMFEANWASSSGDGGVGAAIYNRNGQLKFIGSTTFKDNYGASAISTSSHTGNPTYTLPTDPADITFIGNTNYDGECGDINDDCYPNVA